MRKGVFPDGRTEPDGVVARWYPDPDKNVSGKWMIGGRVERIESGSDTVLLRGRGTDILKIRIAYDSPYFYSRMKRLVFGVPWREASPEVYPILGRDIVRGDYLHIALGGAGIRNSQTADENYQAVIEALHSHGELRGYIVQIYQ